MEEDSKILNIIIIIRHYFFSNYVVSSFTCEQIGQVQLIFKDKVGVNAPPSVKGTVYIDLNDYEPLSFINENKPI